MSFSSMNAFNASKGLSGTSRTNTATFNPAQAQPLQAAPQGMTVDYGASAVPQPNQAKGSSYTLNGGMMGTGRQRMASVDNANSNGVVAGREQPMAPIGGQAPQLTAAEMQDPANAALAGFQFAGTQDQAPSASTNPGARPLPPPPAQRAPVAPTLNPNPTVFSRPNPATVTNPPTNLRM